MASEIEFIHDLEEDGGSFDGSMVLYDLLIRRGWAWRMPAKHQCGARNYIKLGILDDAQFEEKSMTPKIEITTKHGFVTTICSKGSEIEVEVIEEDTGKEVKFTTCSNGSGHSLFPEFQPTQFPVTEEHN